MTIEWEQYDVTIEGSVLQFKNMDVAYEQAVDDDMTNIQLQASGRLMLTRIKTSKGDATIYPYPETDRNASSDFKLSNDGRHYLLDKALVWYSPWTFARNQSMYEVDIPDDLRAFNPADLRDEVLFHELVHTGRKLDGIYKLTPTTDAASPYQNVEDFIAILLTNIYMSEKGKRVFRGSHGSTRIASDKHVILSKEESTSLGFLNAKANYDLVREFCDKDRLAPGFIALDVPFNPIRAFSRTRGTFAPAA